MFLIYVQTTATNPLCTPSVKSAILRACGRHKRDVMEPEIITVTTNGKQITCKLYLNVNMIIINNNNNNNNIFGLNTSI